jgi:hypothetical protein
VTRRQVQRVLADHGAFCEWCGISLGPDRARVVERDAGPLPFCGTCEGRYQRPDTYPYVRTCLARQGK